VSSDPDQSPENTPGRPTLCTAETTEAYCKAVRRHLPQHLCAANAGVSADAVQSWFKRGARGEEPYATFVVEVGKAKAKAAGKLTSRIDKASKDPKEWRAAAHLLKQAHLSAPLPTAPTVGGTGGEGESSTALGEAAELDEEQRVTARIRRLETQLALAQGTSQVAALHLSRDLDEALDKLAQIRRAKQVRPEDQDEETFLELLGGQAEAMPEPHLRVLADAWCRRHRVRFVRDERWKRDESGEWYFDETEEVSP
jgi:hypothetical protein